MRGGLDQLAWPLSRLGEALEALARRSGLLVRGAEQHAPPFGLLAADRPDPLGSLGPWLEEAAAWLGVEAEEMDVAYPEVETLLRVAGPALLGLPGPAPRLLLLLRGGGGNVTLLGPDHGAHAVPSAVVRDALCRHLEAPVEVQVERMLSQVGVPPRRQERSRRAVLWERLGGARVRGVWLLRLPPSAHFGGQVLRAGVGRRLLLLLGAHAGMYGLALLSWWLLGRSVLAGRADTGWLTGWLLLLLSLLPLRLLSVWLEGMAALDAGGLLKQRLLAGALQLDPGEVRAQGTGQVLSRILESEALERLATSGGVAGLLGGLELVLAAGVLSAAGGRTGVGLLAAWVALTGVLAWRYHRGRRGWTAQRLGLTHELVERMVGHRTRLAQEAPARRHQGEDEALEGYLAASRRMDRDALLLTTLVPRGWLLLGVLGLLPSFLAGGAPARLAVALGGVLLAYGALRRMAPGLMHISGAANAWQLAGPLFHAAARPEPAGSPAAAADTSTPPPGGGRPTVLDARDLRFGYPRRGEPVLRGCTLRILRGDRLLLEGPSGGGKSTLCGLLSGLRQPQGGLLLLGGLDPQTVGPRRWRRLVAAAPQFHENHVLTGPFAFNLLMGRRWPPRREDLAEAEALCRELGLGELLGRMPGGMMQMVGETGWQLSHGERSRLYLARALLQRADLVILDESFGALDPETLRLSLECVLRRAPTLLVIAHP